MALSDKATHEKIVLLDELAMADTKTKKFFEVLQNLSLRPKNAKSTKGEKKAAKEVKKEKRPKSVLVVLSEKSDAIVRSARNIPRITVIRADSLNILDVVKHQFVLMPTNAVSVIEKTFVK
jgi:large subunit ribosomal protein L4